MGILKVDAKCSDLCSLIYTDKEGKQIQSDGYVPEGIGIGEFYGDYIEMEIDMETGQIQNWKPLTDAQIIKSIKKVQ